MPAFSASPATIWASGTWKGSSSLSTYTRFTFSASINCTCAPACTGSAAISRREAALAGGVEALGLVLSGIQRGGEPHVGTRGTQLQDPRRGHQRQRDRAGGRVVVAEVGDRAVVLRCGLRIGGGHTGVPLPSLGVGVVHRVVAHLELPHVTARLGEGQLLAVDDLRGGGPRGTLQRQARVDREQVSEVPQRAGDANATAARGHRGERYGERRQSGDAHRTRAMLVLARVRRTRQMPVAARAHRPARCGGRGGSR